MTIEKEAVAVPGPLRAIDSECANHQTSCIHLEIFEP